VVSSLDASGLVTLEGKSWSWFRVLLWFNESVTV
jgi:hypothetical protein